jgi:hypothetical protein
MSVSYWKNGNFKKQLSDKRKGKIFFDSVPTTGKSFYQFYRLVASRNLGIIISALPQSCDKQYVYVTFHPGLPDLSQYNIPKRGKTYQMNIKYTMWSQNGQNHHRKYQHMYSIARPLKIYPNLDFWFENIPSGNTAFHPPFKRPE